MTMPENPFALPGLMRDVDPLNPVRNEGHLSLYVPVDNTERAFEEFCRQFADPSYLRDDGRLVLTAGGRGCGKTSLINRCAHWLQQQLRAANLIGEVIDVTKEAQDNESMADRRAKACKALLDKLYERKVFASKLAYEHRHSPDDALSMLPTCLAPDRVLIVLLPPSEDLTEELVQYTADARRRMVFFAETSYDLPDEHRRRMDRAGALPPVHLRVGRLNPTDAGIFARERLSSVPPGALPPVADTALDEFTSHRLVPIGEIQRLLYGLYEQLRVQNDRPEEVTFHHIVHHFLRTAGSLLETQP
ncbi:hypothetical protein [Micromonospora sp. NPDC126480]|uniref:hypothetical protein n=1 Tax=Micromonospora sp. NPDC126480 TaxID=3155312 RepID=UPI003327C33C